MKSIELSVFVPSYQQGNYIGKCLESIHEQDFKNYEVFVYDCNSSDETSTVLKRFSSIFNISIENDSGQAHAINKALLRSRGEILCYLNSDDVFSRGCFERVVSYFNENPNVDMVYGKARYIDEVGDVIGDYLTREWDSSYIYNECFICQPAVFWRRRVFEKIGSLEQKLNFSMDYDYWLRMLGAGFTISHIHDYLAYSRDYPETKTRSGVDKVYWENFRILLRRRGRVSANWISGYLNLLQLKERKPWCFFVPKSHKMRNLIGAILSGASTTLARDVHQLTEKAYNKII